MDENMKIDMISLIFDSQGNHYLPGIACALQSYQLLCCNKGKGSCPLSSVSLFTGDFVLGCWWCGHFSKAPEESVVIAGVVESLLHKPDRPLGFQMLILFPFLEAFYGFLAA
jgi:hypothetical protein